MTYEMKNDPPHGVTKGVVTLIPQLTRHKIQVLLEAGHPQQEVAERSGVGLRTVQRVAKENPITDCNDSAQRHERQIGRPSKTEPFRKFIKDTLKEKEDIMTLELLRRARGKGYDGGKSAFYEFVAAIRTKEAQYTMRFEGLPGEFSQHDFGEVNINFIDGTKMKIIFFASRLKYSRWVEVTIVPNQKVEAVVRTLVEHFEAFGGMPLLAVFDRPKTIAIKWNRAGEVTEWNRTFAYVTMELGLGVELCWPYRPNQKGSVENLVGWVKGSFFKQRRFHDFEDLLMQLEEWLKEVNTERKSRATGEIPAILRAKELPRLRPLKIAPENLALRYPVYIGPTAYVRFEGRSYSMPPEAASTPGTLYLYKDRVKIIAGTHVAVHDRYPTTGKSTLREHRAARLAALSGKRGKRYLKRQDLLDTGEAAEVFLTELVHRRNGSWIEDVNRLHFLLQRHGSEAMRIAFGEAIRENTFTPQAVERYLGLQQHSQRSLVEVVL